MRKTSGSLEAWQATGLVSTVRATDTGPQSESLDCRFRCLLGYLPLPASCAALTRIGLLRSSCKSGAISPFPSVRMVGEK